MAIGIWEMLAIGLSYCGVTLGYIVFVYFMNRLQQIRRTTKEILPIIGLMILFFCGATAFLLVSWFDYFRWAGVGEILILFKTYSLMYFGSVGIIYVLMEYVLKKTKYILSLYVVVALLFVVFTNTMDDINFFTLIFGLPLFVMSPFFWYFVFLRKTSGYLRIRMVIAYLGFCLVGSGLVLRNDSFVESFGMTLFVTGTSFGVIGVILAWYGFSALSTFSDLGWKEKLRELFVISSNGISLYAFSFQKNQALEDTDLIAGGFSGIQTLLSEMVKTDQTLQLIDYRDLKIMLEQSKDVSFILILEEASVFVRYKLKVFSEDFQTFFKESLQTWMGETGTFQPAKTLVRRVFELT